MGLGRAVGLGLALLLATGCGVFGCERDTEVITVTYGGAFETIQRDLVATYERRDYDCVRRLVFSGATAVAEEWTCTGCR